MIMLYDIVLIAYTACGVHNIKNAIVDYVPPP